MGQDVIISPPVGADDRPGPAYAATPAGATRGVVVIHEVYGRAPEIDRVVDRFAALGYAAVAPDLFHGGQLRCLQQVMRAMRSGRDIPATRQARRAREWLIERCGLAPEAIGVIGFCFGGGFALMVGHDFGAVSTNYGMIPPTERLSGLPPVIGCYGGRDRSFRGNAKVLGERLEAAGVRHEVHLFEDAGHSFLTDGDRPITNWLSGPLFGIRLDPDNAERGWSRILDFFEAHLRPPSDRPGPRSRPRSPGATA